MHRNFFSQTVEEIALPYWTEDKGRWETVTDGHRASYLQLEP